MKKKAIGKGICCNSAEHGDNDLELVPDEILADGIIKKGLKEQNQLEVAIGDGMEFTIHGDLKNKTKRAKSLLLNSKVFNCIISKNNLTVFKNAPTFYLNNIFFYKKKIVDWKFDRNSFR